MKPIDQSEFKTGYGDCFRACVASIFEFPLERMPNFWVETQDAREFWKKVNNWLACNYGHKCICMELKGGHEYFIQDVLCIANGRTERGKEEHAVVWLNGCIHDPHPLRKGLVGEVNTFIVFIPLTISSSCKGEKEV